MADYIYTVSKKRFYPLSPRIEDIDIADIAHALSMIARANGHFPEFHSVAQHSIECAREALARGLGSKLSLACLLHDGAEAYMSDVTTPVKSKLADYRAYEDKLINMIYQKYIGALSDEEKQLVYQIDKDLLYHEFYAHMHIELGNKSTLKTNPDFGFRPFDEVKREYLELFRQLTQAVV
ncbi:MAG: phosphohydrolase [Clostridia bacterium]|nr:phosphohydrolase [Clostridia bacterium]